MLDIKNPNLRLTTQTERGLMVSMKSTLELIKYLNEKVGYKYLITRRTNQDALEVNISSILPPTEKKLI